mmetsp:Transcript_6560/g.13207  ORF Transcript_6560/g.13207 Transcript_6560/m.13207 type:complete len:143 (-) Transcript_6560:547-975(-)
MRVLRSRCQFLSSSSQTRLQRTSCYYRRHQTVALKSELGDKSPDFSVSVSIFVGQPCWEHKTVECSSDLLFLESNHRRLIKPCPDQPLAGMLSRAPWPCMVSVGNTAAFMPILTRPDLISPLEWYADHPARRPVFRQMTGVV